MAGGSKHGIAVIDDRAPEPSEDVARQTLVDALGVEARTVERFANGLCHFVYDVTTGDNRRMVVRLTTPALRDRFVAALRWHDALTPLGLPLPAILFSDVDPSRPFPVIVMERLPGIDLGDAYHVMSPEQKTRLAGEIAAIQKKVATLPHGSGYGYGRSFNDDALLPTWVDALSVLVERSRGRIRKAGLIDLRLADEVEIALRHHADYFASVPPRAYLDDTTTKNVIVNDGRLAGIVDIDFVAFGDGLMTPALTHVALTARGDDTRYVDGWIDALDPDRQQMAAFRLYVALYCLDLLSEVGHQFNRDQPIAPDRTVVERLIATLGKSLSA